MRAVRTSLVVGTVVASAWLTAMLFGACRGSHPGPADSPPAEQPTATERPLGSTETTAPSASAPDVEPEDAGASTEDEQLRALQQCAAPRVSIVNVPDGGVVFNNAMTSADAGFIDRTQGVIDVLVGLSREVRCCLGPWAEQHHAGRGTLMLLLELDPGGSATKVDVDAERSTITEALAIRCVLDAVRRGRYPQSPTGSPTRVEYPIEVAGEAR